MEENVMKAQMEIQPGVWKGRDVAVPVPGEGELLLKLRVCALLQSENVHGRGFFGTVEELGPGVSDFEIGDRVAACTMNGTCFSNYVCVRRENCWSLSEELDDYTSAFVAPLAYVLRTIEISSAPLAKPCVVMGAQFLRTALACARGMAPVVAVVSGENERAAVLKIGADFAVDDRECDDTSAEIGRILDGQQAALVIEECAPSRDSMQPWAWEDAVALLTYRRIDLKPLYSVAAPLEGLQGVIDELKGPDGPVVVFIDTSLKSRFTFPGYREPVSATIQPPSLSHRQAGGHESRDT